MKHYLRSAPALAAVCLLLLGGVASGTEGAPQRGGPPDEARGAKGGKPLPALTHGPKDALTRSLGSGRLTPAKYALERSRSLFDLRAVRARYGDVAAPDPKEATLLLRDLALRQSELGAADKRTATRILARPTGGSNPFDGVSYGSAKRRRSCPTVVPLCFHWAVEGQHAPSLRDADGDGIPNWVEVTIAQFDTVWEREIESFGFRRPKNDRASRYPGPNGRTDIYLANIGVQGIYGYCTSDDPNLGRLGSDAYPYYDVSAYCVVDDDYSRAEFPAKTPLQNLKVTAAHEFFHAVQFAYDIAEDAWLMEGTATAIEDAVFDGVNDNYQYLKRSPLTQPKVSVDYSSEDMGSAAFGFRYGAWIFWRFMTERLGPGLPEPGVLREVWEHADASSRQAYGDQYSLQAAASVSRKHGLGFGELFADFGAQNFIADEFYAEGEAYQAYLEALCAAGSSCSVSEGGRPPFANTFTLTSAAPSTGTQVNELDHLSNKYVRLQAGEDVQGAVLEVSVDGPALWRGTQASLVVFDPAENAPRIERFTLDAEGRGSLTVPAFGAMSRVVLVLTNASTRMDCYRYPNYASSCAGIPRDQNLPFSYQATISP